MRVSRNAFGANTMNHSLNRSTDWAMSAFHLSGLARLTGNWPLFSIYFPGFPDLTFLIHIVGSITKIPSTNIDQLFLGL